MATDLVSEGFTRERVKNRMLRRAADLWGYTETDLDSFDPLVALLIEACSVEFERVSIEMGSTQTRLLDRLAQIMHPEPDVPRPAFGIAQLRSVEPQAVVPVTAQLCYKRAGTSRADSASAAEMYFSPIVSSPVVNGAIRYMATTETLFQMDEGTQKMPIAQQQGAPVVLPYQSLWLGLELDERVESLEGLSFFFDWPADTRPEACQSIPAGSSWRLGGQALTVRTGLPGQDMSVYPATSFVSEFDVMHKVEKQALSALERQFVTIDAAPLFKSIPSLQQSYPPAVGQWFAERDLRLLREPLWWIELQLPHTVSTQALPGMVVGLNGVPVMNRRLHRITYRLQQNLNIIPLETEQYFLAMREVRTSKDCPLTAIPLGSLTDLAAGTYTVQYGVSRFDDRDSRQTLINLQDLLRNESAAFAALGEDFLSSIIRELNQTLARLEAKVDQKTRKRDSIPYLVIKPQKPGETVFVEYWTCDGEAANRLPVGSRLSPYADSSLRKEAAFLLTATTGGRERPKEAEKITQYKQALLTRNRIVTLEDVRAVCQTELGQHIRSMQVERAFRIDPAPANGFQRCIRVSLEPSATSTYTPADWQQQATLLERNLESQSVGMLPFQVLIL
ncbi:type VI secretion system baseplate subunit TssF [Spirosoma luteum]|uniref:type VI secretion system baseplate subunit TssF n=1 Tax=Spirosoma luteum TaxID=431553 RepID=UPI000378DF1E|nr:type VI secretion system baseplate subunit TssF [Spirosoma luteum]